MFHLFRRTSSFNRRTPTRRPSTRLTVELLEDRLAPAIDMVTNTSDNNPGSLRATIAGAASGDTITFASNVTGLITLTSGNITTGKALTIQGPGAGLLTISGNNASNIFDFTSLSPVADSISGLTLTGGNAVSGGAIQTQGDLTLADCIITGNTATGIFIAGGGVYSIGSYLTIQNCTFTNNQATGVTGSGAAVRFYPSGGTAPLLTISGSSFINNSGAEGGALSVFAGLNITHSTFADNKARTLGGGSIFAIVTQPSTISNTTISGSQSGNHGGALYGLVGSAALTLEDCTISGNTAPSGGGIYSNGSPTFGMNLLNCTVADNTATTSGGGIDNLSGNFTLTSTIVAGNTAPLNSDLLGIFNAGTSLIQTPGTAIINQVGGANILNQDPQLGPLQDNGGFMSGAPGDLTPILTQALASTSPAIDKGSNPANLTTDERGTGFVRTFGGGTDIGAFEVQPFPTSTTLTVSPSAPSVGQTATLTATVAANAGVDGPPTGTVNFFDNGFLIGSGTLSNGVATFTTAALVAGSYRFTAVYVGNNSFITSTSPPVSVVVTVPPAPVIVAGADAGGLSQVTVFNANGTDTASFYAFPLTFGGGVRVATADINGDGVADLIVAAGPGGGPQVMVIDGTKLNQVQSNGLISPSAILASFYAFAPGFTGGVFVAAAVSASGQAEIVCGADAGGGPQVEVIDGSKINQLQSNGTIASAAVLSSFYAFSPGFGGGVRVALGDVNNDGTLDVVCSAGPGGGPQVIVVDGTKLTQLNSAGQPSSLLASFYAVTPSYTGGIYVALGNTGSGSQLNVIIGAGPNFNSEVIVIDGTQLPSGGQIARSAELATFSAFAPGFAGSVRVASADVNGDGRADVVTAAGPGGGPQVTTFDALSQDVLSSFYATQPSFQGGIFD